MAGSCDDYVVYQGVVLFCEIGQEAERKSTMWLGVLAMIDLLPTFAVDTALIPIDGLVWCFGGYDSLWPGLRAES